MGRLHRLTHIFFYKKDVKSADFIVTNSRGTSDKLKHFFRIKTDQIINPSVSPTYFKRNKDEINGVLEKYQINSDYLLFVGNLEPRKNLLLVINSFIELVQEKKISDVKLLIVGLKGWKNSKLNQLIDQYSDYIQLSGYVAEHDLPAIYSQAKTFVFPSLYEGFGIPVREALMCGTSVITSDISELREAGEIVESNAQITFIDPHSKEELKCSILKYLHYDINEYPSNNIPRIEISNLIKFITK
nr:glycosyltransferase family 1 protein [Chryseobacterium tagetis]